MAKFHVYLERKVSTTVEVDADTYEAALEEYGEHEPYAPEPDGCDWAGEWEPLVVEQGSKAVWEAPRLGKIPVQDQARIQAAMTQMLSTLSAAGTEFARVAEKAAQAIFRAPTADAFPDPTPEEINADLRADAAGEAHAQ